MIQIPPWIQAEQPTASSQTFQQHLAPLPSFTSAPFCRQVGLLAVSFTLLHIPQLLPWVLLCAGTVFSSFHALSYSVLRTVPIRGTNLEAEAQRGLVSGHGHAGSVWWTRIWTETSDCWPLLLKHPVAHLKFKTALWVLLTPFPIFLFPKPPLSVRVLSMLQSLKQIPFPQRVPF